MTVNPGWGGQKFIPASLAKIERLRELLGPDVPIEVDGGIDEHTAGPVVAAGATWLVAGTAVFGAPDPAVAFERIAAAAGAALV
jgi:ribulose-phosphate 3-epimerase